MAELFHHTDEDGDRIRVDFIDDFPGSLGVVVRGSAGRVAAVCLHEDAGRRLFAALLSHYGSPVSPASKIAPSGGPPVTPAQPACSSQKITKEDDHAA